MLHLYRASIHCLHSSVLRVQTWTMTRDSAPRSDFTGPGRIVTGGSYTEIKMMKRSFCSRTSSYMHFKVRQPISSLSCLHIARAPFLSTACRRLVLVRISCGVMYVVPFEIHGEIVSPNTVTLFVIFVAGFLQESARVGQCSCLETLRL